MRRGVAIAALVLAACGEPSVAERLDALQGRYVHQTRPSPKRTDLYPEADTRSDHMEARLRGDENSRAILDAGAAAVPALVQLLDDSERRTKAAFFLGEIGGPEAAKALLARWRELRDDAKNKRVYHRMGDTITAGDRYEGVDQEFYGELVFALSYAGLPVSAEIAADTEAAMDEAERLQAAGEELRRKESREEEAGPVDLRWHVEPVETAEEGLELLAMVGAPEAPRLFERALGSPVRALQYTAIQNTTYLGKGAAQLLPAVAALLDDPDLRDEALETLELLYREVLSEPKSEQDWRAAAERWKRRVREEPLPG